MYLVGVGIVIASRSKRNNEILEFFRTKYLDNLKKFIKTLCLYSFCANKSFENNGTWLHVPEGKSFQKCTEMVIQPWIIKPK